MELTLSLFWMVRAGPPIGINPVIMMEVTEMMQASARSGSGGSNTLLATDLFIDSGAVTNIQSCSDAAGGNTVTNYNDGGLFQNIHYWKFTIQYYWI